MIRKYLWPLSDHFLRRFYIFVNLPWMYLTTLWRHQIPIFPISVVLPQMVSPDRFKDHPREDTHWQQAVQVQLLWKDLCCWKAQAGAWAHPWSGFPLPMQSLLQRVQMLQHKMHSWEKSCFAKPALWNVRQNVFKWVPEEVSWSFPFRFETTQMCILWENLHSQRG